MEVQEPQHYTCTLCDHRVAVEVYWCVLNSRYNYKIISNRISAALQSNLSLSFSLSVSVFYLSPHSPPSLSVFVTFSVPPSLILFLSVSPCHSAFILTVHPLTLQQFVILHSTHPGGHKYGCGKIWSVCSGSEMVCVCVRVFEAALSSSLPAAVSWCHTSCPAGLIATSSVSILY